MNLEIRPGFLILFIAVTFLAVTIAQAGVSVTEKSGTQRYFGSEVAGLFTKETEESYRGLPARNCGANSEGECPAGLTLLGHYDMVNEFYWPSGTLNPHNLRPLESGILLEALLREKST